MEGQHGLMEMYTQLLSHPSFSAFTAVTAITTAAAASHSLQTCAPAWMALTCTGLPVTSSIATRAIPTTWDDGLGAQPAGACVRSSISMRGCTPARRELKDRS